MWLLWTKILYFTIGSAEKEHLNPLPQHSRRQLKLLCNPLHKQHFVYWTDVREGIAYETLTSKIKSRTKKTDHTGKFPEGCDIIEEVMHAERSERQSRNKFTQMKQLIN